MITVETRNIIIGSSSAAAVVLIALLIISIILIKKHIQKRKIEKIESLDKKSESLLKKFIDKNYEKIEECKIYQFQRSEDGTIGCGVEITYKEGYRKTGGTLPNNETPGTEKYKLQKLENDATSFEILEIFNDAKYANNVLNYFQEKQEAELKSYIDENYDQISDITITKNQDSEVEQWNVNIATKANETNSYPFNNKEIANRIKQHYDSKKTQTINLSSLTDNLNTSTIPTTPNTQ